MLTEAGFAEPTFHGWTGYFTSSYTQGGLITARKPGVDDAAPPGTGEEQVGIARVQSA